MRFGASWSSLHVRFRAVSRHLPYRVRSTGREGRLPATYTYNWEGAQGDVKFTVRGRGTRVLLSGPGGLRIVHEHLSRYPGP
jgi:hypothetical protein